jgi:BON domain
MALLRGIGRAVPLIAAGVAAGWYLRRQGMLGPPARPELPWPPESEPEPEAEPLEAHVEAVEAVSDAADVTSVVEDLLAVAPSEEAEIADAEVVDEPDDVDERVRTALAEVPGLVSGSVQVESDGGTVWLRGELERAEAITEAERRAAAVSGVTEVRNLLHLPGTPPPTA